MTRFIKYEVMVKEDQIVAFEKIMSNAHFPVRRTDSFVITNLSAFFDEKQQKF